MTPEANFSRLSLQNLRNIPTSHLSITQGLLRAENDSQAASPSTRANVGHRLSHLSIITTPAPVEWCSRNLQFTYCTQNSSKTAQIMKNSKLFQWQFVDVKGIQEISQDLNLRGKITPFRWIDCRKKDLLEKTSL